VLDGSGFVRRSKMLAGNVAEASTLQDMLKDLAAPSGALVILDAGIATEANITWLSSRDTAIWWSAANAPATSIPSRRSRR
jgi:hypothetical protein